MLSSGNLRIPRKRSEGGMKCECFLCPCCVAGSNPFFVRAELHQALQVSRNGICWFGPEVVKTTLKHRSDSFLGNLPSSTRFSLHQLCHDHVALLFPELWSLEWSCSNLWYQSWKEVKPVLPYLFVSLKHWYQLNEEYPISILNYHTWGRCHCPPQAHVSQSSLDVWKVSVPGYQCPFYCIGTLLWAFGDLCLKL